MEAHENGRIIKMGDNIHWLERYEDNFLPDHKDINTFIKINFSFDKEVDFINSSYNDTIRMYDMLFTADAINEYISTRHHLLHVIGTVGYSADTDDVELIYDKKANKIYVYGKYKLVKSFSDASLYNDYIEISNNKYMKLERTDKSIKFIEVSVNGKNLDEDIIPHYRFPRNKEYLSIPRVIFNVFKVFSDTNVPKEDKPKIVICVI